KLNAIRAYKISPAREIAEYVVSNIPHAHPKAFDFLMALMYCEPIWRDVEFGLGYHVPKQGDEWTADWEGVLAAMDQQIAQLENFGAAMGQLSRAAAAILDYFRIERPKGAVIAIYRSTMPNVRKVHDGIYRIVQDTPNAFMLLRRQL